MGKLAAAHLILALLLAGAPAGAGPYGSPPPSPGAKQAPTRPPEVPRIPNVPTDATRYRLGGATKGDDPPGKQPDPNDKPPKKPPPPDTPPDTPPPVPDRGDEEEDEDDDLDNIFGDDPPDPRIKELQEDMIDLREEVEWQRGTMEEVAQDFLHSDQGAIARALQMALDARNAEQAQDNQDERKAAHDEIKTNDPDESKRLHQAVEDAFLKQEVARIDGHEAERNEMLTSQMGAFDEAALEDFNKAQTAASDAQTALVETGKILSALQNE